MAKSEREIWFTVKYRRIRPCHPKGWISFAIFLTLVFGVLFAQEFIPALQPHSFLGRWGPLALPGIAYYIVFLLHSE